MELKIDPQIKGSKHDCIALKTFNTEADCLAYFDRLKSAFFSVNYWGELFLKGTTFQMVKGNDGVETAIVEEGIFVKIDIPGPKSTIGNGYDWMEIVALPGGTSDTEEWYCIVVSPSRNPLKDVAATAHFFQPCAKNYFIIRKHGLTVSAEVHGRNEVPNYKNVPFLHKIRNFAVAEGAKLGFSKLHWETFSKNLLDPIFISKINRKAENQ